jgi:predicted amidophosphoribosyltransferase
VALVLALLLPERCAVCEAPGEPLCDGCRAALIRLAPPLCERCGSPGAWPVRRCAECAGRRLGFASARAAIVYDERARRLVGAWKERGRRRIAALAADLVAEAVPQPDVDAIAFVPPDPERFRKRGDAPPASLARELGARWQLPVVPLLRRTRSGKRQTGHGLADRRRNVRGAFAPAGDAPRTVILVDDVYTSGATAAACATELRRGGARRVDVVSLARAVR